MRTLLYGRKETPLVHSGNLGLLYCDSPSQKTIEVMAENEAREAAKEEVNQFWTDMPINLKNAERCKLAAQHRAQIKPGAHFGHANFNTGLCEKFLVTDILTTPDELRGDRVSDLPPRYAGALEQLFNLIRI